MSAIARALLAHLRAQWMGAVALFLVIAGGGAYAITIGRDSVGSKQIKAGAVKRAELAGDAVTSSKVANGSLRGRDFSGQLPQGPPGPPGDPATRLFAVVNGTSGNLSYGSGVVDAGRTGVGSYQVAFDRPLAGCAVVATPGVGRPNGVGDVYQPGSRATVDFAAFAPDSGLMTVATTDNAGTPADRSFHVAVFC